MSLFYGRWPALVGCASAALLGSCAQDFSTQRVPNPEGTLGEEIFRVVCERVDVGENPSDLTFDRARHACTTGLTPSAPDDPGVGPKVNSLGHGRSPLVASLDATMPVPTHASLDRLLVNLLPLYGPDGSGQTDASGHTVITLTDGGTVPAEDILPQTTRSLGALLDGWSTDIPALRGLSRMSNHRGYRPGSSAIGLARPLLTYGQIDDVLDNALRLFRDGATGVPPGAANGHFNTFLSTLKGEFAASGPADDVHGGTVLDATADLLLRTDPSLAAGTSIGLVRRDFRGMPSVATRPDGTLPPPFADDNHDGLADAAGGVFVHGAVPVAAPTPYAITGGPTVARDPGGRALAQGGGGSLLYNYVNLDASVLAAVARQLPPLLGRPTYQTVPAMQMLHGASVLFGSRRMATRDYGPAGQVPYRQFSADTAPVVDLVHAAGQFLALRDIDPVLTTTRALVDTDRQAVTARVVGAMLGVNDIANRHPEATIAETSQVWDDVMDVLKAIALEPGLLEDMLAAMALHGDEINRLAPAFAAYARNRDRVEPAWGTAGMPLTTARLSQPVDRTRGDTADNRSALARLLHLVDDLNGARLCSRDNAQIRVTGIPLFGGLTVPGTSNTPECGIFRVDDAASFYVRAIDRRGHIDMHIPGLSGVILTFAQNQFPGLGLAGLMDRLIEAQSHITGFNSSPTPQAINRLVFRPDPDNCTPGSDDFLCNLVAPAANRFGEPTVRQDHPGTIFVWELYGFYDAIRPLAHAFILHDRETCKAGDGRAPGDNLCADPANVTGFDPAHGTHLFVQLLSALHRHWATTAATDYQTSNPAGSHYTTGDGVSRYEPIVAESLDGDVLPALNALTASVHTVDAGTDSTGAHLQGDQAVALLTRALVDPGTLPVSYRDGRTSTLRSNGTTSVPNASLYYLFADAFDGMDTALAADHTGALDDWKTARSRTVDQFLTVDGAGAGARWHNPVFAPVARLFASWLQDRVAAHRTAGDLQQWAHGLGLRFQGSVQGPVFASAIDLALDMNNDRAARTATGGLLDHLLNETPDSPQAASPFATTATAVADLVQILRDDTDVDPVLHAFSPAFAPHTGAGAQGIRFLDRARALDTDHVLTRVLANIVRRPAAGDEPLVVVADAIADTHREHPGLHDPLSPTDFHYVFTNVRDFFTDSTRGMAQFYSIVQHRRLP